MHVHGRADVICMAVTFSEKGRQFKGRITSERTDLYFDYTSKWVSYLKARPNEQVMSESLDSFSPTT